MSLAASGLQEGTSLPCPATCPHAPRLLPPPDIWSPEELLLTSMDFRGPPKGQKEVPAILPHATLLGGLSSDGSLSLGKQTRGLTIMPEIMGGVST